MIKGEVLIIGASGHAKVVIDVIEKEGKYHIAGLIDDKKPKGIQHFGYKLLGSINDMPELIRRNNIAGVIIAIGDNHTRYRLFQRLRLIMPELVFIAAVHPQASIAKGVIIGEGSVVMAGAVINSDSWIGAHCIVNTSSSLDHDSRMGDFSSLAPGSIAGGGISIGKCSAIGLGANIIHNVSIGSHSVIGAGALVLNDINDYSVAYGVPCSKVRSRNEDERYL